MDAREYLARKKLETGRDRERPNTLEEKAWERAREAGDHRPRAGTPYDWEEWERHHRDLAAEAERIEQKIDHDAHRRALDPSTPSRSERRQATAPASSGNEQGAPRFALLALAVLLPPLAVALSGGGRQRLGLNLALTLLGWLPGVVHALHWMQRQRP